MLWFGLIQTMRTAIDQFSCNVSTPSLVLGGDGGPRLRSLLGTIVKYHAAILRTTIVSLAVERRGVVPFPKRVQQRFVRYDGRIKLQIDHFRVSGGTCAHLLVRWLR